MDMPMRQRINEHRVKGKRENEDVAEGVVGMLCVTCVLLVAFGKLRRSSGTPLDPGP